MRKLKKFALIFSFLGAAALYCGCKSRSLGALQSSREGALLKSYDSFCSGNTQALFEGQEPEKQKVEFWSRAEIEAMIDKWLSVIDGQSDIQLKSQFTEQGKEPSQSNVASSILGSYAAAYLKMTEERDKERCKPVGQSKMVSADPLVNQINHALADLMTRQLVIGSIACLDRGQNQGGYGIDPVAGRWEFCDLYFDAAHKGFRIREYNSLTLAMSSAGIYLSSHIAAALSALPFLDRLWVGTEFEGHGQRLEDDSGIWMRRISFIEERYLSSYEAFNSFLSVNIDTVLGALASDHLYNKGTGLLAQAIENKVNVFNAFSALVFKRIRRASFDTGVAMARSLASDPSTRQRMRQALNGDDSRTKSNLLGIHPFLEAVSLVQGDYYYEIGQEPARFNELLLSLNEVRRSRALTWRLRIDFENPPARALFRSLGAVSYSEGFSERRSVTGVRTSACLGLFLTKILEGRSTDVDSFEKKNGGLPYSIQSDFGTDWKLGFNDEKQEALRQLLNLTTTTEDPAACDF